MAASCMTTVGGGPTFAAEFGHLTVSELMITAPKTLPFDASVDQARAEFQDSHVHMILLTSEGLLFGALVRVDLPPSLPPTDRALSHATLEGRMIGPDEPVAAGYQRLLATRQRRLAVVDADNKLQGLLCLKTDRQGFCTDEGVVARARLSRRPTD